MSSGFISVSMSTGMSLTPALTCASRRSSTVAFGGSTLFISHPAVDKLDTGAIRRLLSRYGNAAGRRVEQHLLHARDAHCRVQPINRHFHADAVHVGRELRGAFVRFRERNGAIRTGEEAQCR